MSWNPARSVETPLCKVSVDWFRKRWCLTCNKKVTKTFRIDCSIGNNFNYIKQQQDGQYIVKFVDSGQTLFVSVHEGALVHGLSVLARWCGHFTNEVPKALVEAFKVSHPRATA